MRVWYLSLMRTTKGQMSLHIRAVSPQPLLLALKKKRCRGRFRPNFFPSKAVVLLLLIHIFNVPPIELWGLCVWSLFCYALISFAIILSRKSEHDALLSLSSYDKSSVADPYGALGLSEVCNCGTS